MVLLVVLACECLPLLVGPGFALLLLLAFRLLRVHEDWERLRCERDCGGVPRIIVCGGGPRVAEVLDVVAAKSARAGFCCCYGGARAASGSFGLLGSPKFAVLCSCHQLLECIVVRYAL